MKVSVKVGSRKVYVEINKTTTSKQLTRLALIECKINVKSAVSSDPHNLFKRDLNSCYSMFERALGIEREMSPEENIFEIWLKWSLNNSQRIEFLVKMNCRIKAFQKRILNNPRDVYKVYNKKYMTTLEQKQACQPPVQINIVSKVNKVSLKKANVASKAKKSLLLFSCMPGYQSLSASREFLVN